MTVRNVLFFVTKETNVSNNPYKVGDRAIYFGLARYRAGKAIEHDRAQDSASC